MPVCEICGDEDFECVNSSYYCKTCCTQSQDFGVDTILVEQTPDYSFGVRHVKKRERTRREKNYGRPWTTTEGFQCIIKEMVKVLIKMGANTKLKDIVFKIWTKYLKKTNVAFHSATSTMKPYIITHPSRSRDLDPGSFSDPSPKRLRTLIQEKTISGKPKNVTFEDGDTTLHIDEETGMILMDAEEEVQEKQDCEFKKSLYNHVEKMSVKKTICMCYLGLMYTNNLTMPSDIVRWIRDTKIPYLNASQSLPEDMKFFQTDSLDFTPKNIPSTYTIRKDVGQLAFFLELNDFPDVNMTALISKYIYQMDLPGELHALVRTLVDDELLSLGYRAKKNRKLLPPFETIAIAYIVFLVKLLFGLDDSTEKELSGYARQLAQVTDSEGSIFVWDEWVKHITKKVSEKKIYLTQKVFSNAPVINNLNSFLDYCKRNTLQKSRRSAKSDERKSLNPIYRQPLQRIFSTLVSRLEEKSPAASQNVQSTEFTLSGSSNIAERDDFGFFSSIPEKRYCQSLDCQRFRKSSVLYLTNPDSFLRADMHQLSEVTISSSFNSSSDDDSSVDLDDCHGFLDRSTMYLPRAEPHQNKRKHTRPRCKVKDIVQEIIQYSECSKRKPTEELQVKELLKNCVKAYENYLTFAQPNSCFRSHSYKWLLTICSCIIEGSVSDIDSFVQDLESMFITGHEKVGLHKRSILQKLRWKILFRSEDKQDQSNVIHTDD